MAKILVADDNSNVQKTVALALADMGVDVVSVNNGEAAVRRLSDFSPDLILADIFMPVRNGYEVCEYVKKEPRFSRVPVVLLVGAFDPLDEREAQRVGADGVLKKPFVPPDPLIAMVKTLLDRTLGEQQLVDVGVSKPSVAVPIRSGGSATAEVRRSAPEVSEQSPSHEYPPPNERVAFGEGAQPLAFSRLLETPAQDAGPSNAVAIEPVDDEQILTSPRDATLGDPIFWRSESREPEPEAEPSEEVSSIPEVRAWNHEEDSLPVREGSLLSKPIAPLELVRDEQEQASPSSVDSQPILIDQAAQAPLNVEADKDEELAANPTEWMATAPPEHSAGASEPAAEWDEAIPEPTDSIHQVESADRLQVSVKEPTSALAPVSAQPDAPIAEETRVPTIPEPSPSVAEETQIAHSPSEQSTEDTARSISKQRWADLTASLPPIKPESAPSPAPVSAQLGAPGAEETCVPPAPEPPVSVPKETPIAHCPSEQGANDTVRSISNQQWADLAASLPASVIELATLRAKSESAPAAHAPAAAPAENSQAASSSLPASPIEAAPMEQIKSENVSPAHVPAAHVEIAEAAPASPAQDAAPDPALVEAVVQRVLDKMRPQVVDIITKEFLRPIVQALVHREIEKQ